MRALLLTWVACQPAAPEKQPPPPSPSSPPPPTYDWTDVAPIVGDRCGGCHGTGGIGGVPLSTWQEVHDARGVVQYAVEERQMPPWPAVPGDYAFKRDLSLTDEQLEILTTWIDEGAPLGDGDPDVQVEAPPPTELPQVDVSLLMPSPYLPPPDVADDYRCFVMEPDGPVGGFIRGFQVAVDNRSLVHHGKLVAIYPRDGGAALDAELALDDEPGFACNDEVDGQYGGPVVRLGSWLPGVDASVFPSGTGLRIEDGAVFVLVLHFHPPGSDGQPDQTRVDLWLTPTVDRPVEAMRLTEPAWRLPAEEGGLLIPAGAADVELLLDQRVARLPLLQFNPAENGVDLVSAQFHMHEVGRSAKLTHTRDGDTLVVLDVPAWDFDWQLDYWPVEPIHLEPRDQLTLSCIYDNTDGGTDVTWGEGSEDEMCGVALNLVPAWPEER